MGKSKKRDTCPFCGKRNIYLPRHNCKDIMEARDYWRDWKDETEENKRTDLFDKYPTFKAWVKGANTGEIAVNNYPYGPQIVEKDEPPEQDMDTFNVPGWDTVAPPATNQDNEGQADQTGVREESPMSDFNALSSSPSGDIGEIAPQRPGIMDGIKDTVKDIVTEKDLFRLSAKDRGWLPVVHFVHHGLMFLFDAKARGNYKKLDKRDKKVLSHSWFCTFGEAPWTKKMKHKGDGEFDQHILSGYMEVYGEFAFENAPGIWSRIKSLGKRGLKALKKRREQKDVEVTVQSADEGTQVQ